MTHHFLNALLISTVLAACYIYLPRPFDITPVFAALLEKKTQQRVD